MLTFDLHYHPNICHVTQMVRKQRLSMHVASIKKCRVDYVACTEHSYKKPLDAYFYMEEALQQEKCRTFLIPGVECISKEGVDIIFLYDSVFGLINGLRCHRPFSWSIWDLQQIRRDTGAIVIIPHPFSMGKTGLGTVLGMDAYFKILDQAHYVETHNSSSFLLRRFAYGGMQRINKLDRHIKQLRYTHNLPNWLRKGRAGWAVGSDAHHPWQQFFIGGVERSQMFGQNWFDFLKSRVQFNTVPTTFSTLSKERNFYYLIKNGRCVFGEFALKSSKKIWSNNKLWIP